MKSQKADSNSRTRNAKSIASMSARAEFVEAKSVTSASALVGWEMQSPLGQLAMISDGERLLAVRFGDLEELAVPGVTLDAPPRKDRAPFRQAIAELDAYFAGKLQDFALPIRLVGTPFQQSVWRALLAIPYGETISYAELARRIGSPSAIRAVGAANGRNPIAIVVPCHRVIGADQSLVGYSCGIERKQWLLDQEGSLAGLKQSTASNAREPASTSGQRRSSRARAAPAASAAQRARTSADRSVERSPSRTTTPVLGKRRKDPTKT